jgi:hypothetical protein
MDNGIPATRGENALTPSAFVDTPWKIVFRFLKRLVFFPKKLFPWGSKQLAF